MFFIAVILLIFHFNIIYINCICIPRHMSSLIEMKEQMFIHNMAMRNKLLETMEEKKKNRLKGPASWYLLDPLYSCEDTSRIGDVVGDGAKYVCNLHHVKQNKHCLYYGVGVNRNILFDQALREALPLCEMHVFDPSERSHIERVVTELREANITFHTEYGLSNSDGPLDVGKLAGSSLMGKTLDTIQHELAHEGRAIDILKIDIEGGEFAVLNSLLKRCNHQTPFAHQLLVEFHLGDQQSGRTDADFLKLANKLISCGYRPFVKDVNLFCLGCMEYGFVHEKFIQCMDV